MFRKVLCYATRKICTLPKKTTFASCRCYASQPKRFYKNTSVIYSGDGKYEITLDNRKLKTMQGKPLIVDSEPMAIAIASEWDAQKERIERSTMHLTALCNTAIDNPNNLKKEDLVNYILNYLPTDAILYQSEKDDELYEFQCAEWDPIIDWFNRRYDTEIQKCRDIVASEMKSGTQMKISKHLMSHNIAALHGYTYSVDILKSAILAFACIDRHITVEQTVRLGRLEEEFQIKHWGRVEWAHDINEFDSRARLAAAVLFVHFNTSEHLIKQKQVG